jgi:hypothetical protein
VVEVTGVNISMSECTLLAGFGGEYLNAEASPAPPGSDRTPTSAARLEIRGLQEPGVCFLEVQKGVWGQPVVAEPNGLWLFLFGMHNRTLRPMFGSRTQDPSIRR